MTHDMLSPMTAEQLFALPSDGRRRELVKGELRMMSPAGSEHGAVIFKLTALLGSYLAESPLGEAFGAETGFLISRDPDTVRAPDIAFVTAERIAESGLPKSFWPGVPDLAIEVVSPSERIDDVEEKVKLWLTSGCREVWVVSPVLRTVTLYRSLTEIEIYAGTQTVDGSLVLPELRCPLSKVFAGLK
jgi:Uma2 family endonuclease